MGSYCLTHLGAHHSLRRANPETPSLRVFVSLLLAGGSTRSSDPYINIPSSQGFHIHMHGKSISLGATSPEA